jgi:surface polysaccharide O-acyltransferase-like enzyme
MTADSETTLPPSVGARPGRSAALDILRVTAILGVIAIHVFAGLTTNPAIRGSGTWWVANAIDLGSVWVIPVFVMVSGALLLSPRAHADGPAEFYRKRLLRLGPAFVFWQAFYIVVVRILLSHQHLSFGAVLQLIGDGTTYTHLYFLWLIVGLYVIAPVLAAFLNGGGPRRAYIFAGVVLLFTLSVYALSGWLTLRGDAHPIVLNALTQWVPYVGYFLAGWALRAVVLRWTWTLVVAIATLALLAVTVWQHATGPHPLLDAVSPAGYIGFITGAASIGVFVVGLSLFAGVDARGRSARAIHQLSDATFGVYLVHFFFLVLLITLVPAVAQARSTSLLGAFGVWAAIVVVSFAVSLGARRVPYLRRIF